MKPARYFTSPWPFKVLLRGVREVLYEEDGGAGPGPVPPRPRVCHPPLPQRQDEGQATIH